MSAELSDQEKRDLPCFGSPAMWQDSNSVEDQKQAARLCATSCAQRAWCDRERLSTAAEFGIATGVWAGRIWTHRDYAPSGSSPVRVIPVGSIHAS